MLGESGAHFSIYFKCLKKEEGVPDMGQWVKNPTAGALVTVETQV